MVLVPKRKMDYVPENVALMDKVAPIIEAPDRVIRVNDSDVVLTLIQDGSGKSLSLEGGAPDFTFAETDQTDPAGRFRFRATGDTLILEAAATAAWATDTDILTAGGSPRILTSNVPFTATEIRGSQIQTDTTTAGDQVSLGAYVGASVRNLLASENVASGNILGILGSSSAAAELRGANNASVFIETSISVNQMLQLRAYDVDGAAYRSLVTLTAANAPTLQICPSNDLLGFFGTTPANQRQKANYNNWAAFGDVVNALVALGLFDTA